MKLKLCWIRVGLKSNRTGIFLRKSEESPRRRDTRENACHGGGRLEGPLPKPTPDCPRHPKQGRGREGIFLRAFQGAWPCCHLDFRTPDFLLCERTLCCFKPRPLWPCVMGSPGKQTCQVVLKPWSGNHHLRTIVSE